MDIPTSQSENRRRWVFFRVWWRCGACANMLTKLCWKLFVMFPIPFTSSLLQEILLWGGMQPTFHSFHTEHTRFWAFSFLYRHYEERNNRYFSTKGIMDGYSSSKPSYSMSTYGCVKPSDNLYSSVSWVKPTIQSIKLEFQFASKLTRKRRTRTRMSRTRKGLRREHRG